MSFKNKVVLITGASSSIGAATAVFFAKQGASLSLTGRNLENLQKTYQNCLKENPTEEPLLIQADVTKDAEKIMEKTILKYQRLDILVNNAGVGGYNGIETTTLQEYDYIMNTNVRAVYHLTMLSVPHLTKTQGNIVNVSSLAGLRSFANSVAYGISKAAINQFTSCVSLELAQKKVRVNAVCPGLVYGEFQKHGGLSEDVYQTIVKSACDSYPLRRPATPDDVAKAILYLASDENAGYLTGVKLQVDGGKFNQCPR